MSQQKCPNCGRDLVLRSRKYGQFLGCSGFPKCKTIVPLNQPQNNEPKVLRKIANPSKYQLAIFDWVLNGEGNAIVSACAGSGKTTTIEHAVALIIENEPKSEVVYGVFNTHVAKTAVDKGLPAKTTHQLGLAAISQYLRKRPEIKEDKVENIIKDLIQSTWDAEKWLISPVSQIVSKVKNLVSPTDDATLDKICERYGIEVNGTSERIYELVRLTLEINNLNLSIIDFDDMLYLPVKMKMPVKQYDWFLGDEAQDFNRAQIELVLRSVKPTGRCLIVGDKFQSMYGFRGADIEAMERIQKSLDAKELPLSITYRCPKSHVRMVNQLFPEIPFEEFSGNTEGDILSISMDRFLGEVEEGSLVLCRTNAPLVKPVFALIRQGVKALIRGRDIGKGLVSLVEKFNVKSTNDLLSKLAEYERKEIAKLIAKEKMNQAQALQDKIETIFAISEGCDWVWQVIQKIEEVFSDKKEGIVFSTVHRAKGDEAKQIYILEPQKMPHPMAKADWEKRQELNILYVALSRSKSKMVFVGGPAPTSFESTEMWAEKEVEEQIINALPEGTEVYKNVEIDPIYNQVTFEEKIVKSYPSPVIENEVKEIPVCPF